jgi:hypothetical protein
MKTRLIGVMAVVLAVGLVSGSAGAAIVTFSLEVDPSGPRYISSKWADASDGNVLLDLYAYFASANGTYADDGIFGTVYGSLKSGVGGLLCDLSWAFVAPGLQATNWSAGTVQDLDGDGDKDIGGPDGQVATDWINLFSGANTLLSPDDGNRLLCGKVILTVTSFAPDPTVNWAFRNKTGLGNSLHSFKVDNVGFTATGTDTRIGVDTPVTIIPEPMTMTLLAVGGTALVAFRRRKRA